MDKKLALEKARLIRAENYHKKLEEKKSQMTLTKINKITIINFD